MVIAKDIEVEYLSWIIRMVQHYHHLITGKHSGLQLKRYRHELITRLGYGGMELKTTDADNFKMWGRIREQSPTSLKN